MTSPPEADGGAAQSQALSPRRPTPAPNGPRPPTAPGASGPSSTSAAPVPGGPRPPTAPGASGPSSTSAAPVPGGPRPPAPRVTRDRRVWGDPHDPPVPDPEPVRRLRPPETLNAPPGRRGPARDAAARHAGDPVPAFDFATGKQRATPDGPKLPPPRSSPPPSAPPPDPPGAARTVGLRGRRELPGRAARPAPGTSRAPRQPGAPRRLGVPVPTQVRFGANGRPEQVDGDRVEAVRESWLIEDRWWTDRPMRRRYWEVVTVGGRDLVLFRDLLDGHWYRQR